MGLFFGLIFGAIGTGYLVYAKQQMSVSFGACGVGLILYPYFLSNAIAILLVGAAVASVPFVLRAIVE